VGINFQGKQSLDELGEQVGESRNQIHRYIRLTELLPDLLEMVDNAEQREKDKPQIALSPAV
jgi:ParB family chromosome partitioning protein